MSANDDKGIQSINSIETDTYATSKDLIYKNENIKCKNTIKQYKWVALIILQEKKWNNKIQIGHKFLIIHTKY